MELSRGSLLKGFAGMAILPFLPKLPSPTPPPAAPPPLVPPRPISGWWFTADPPPLPGDEAARLPPVTIKLYNGDKLLQQWRCPRGATILHTFPMGLACNVTRAEISGGTGKLEFAT